MPGSTNLADLTQKETAGPGTDQANQPTK